MAVGNSYGEESYSSLYVGSDRRLHTNPKVII